ncbi:MAG: NAD(P)-dependent oxidoreductase [Vicinamibacterales bacterium]
MAALAAGERPRHPALAGTPWWHRADRLFDSAAGAAPRSTGSPLLIIGSTGTLGRALQRICEQRGLASQLAGRPEVDITDSRQVDAVLHSLEPWAVVNAAGYVRVDDAEGDAAACYRANVLGPMNLAAACRRRNVPLLTFSSDLVFDGSARRPYLEDDEVRPLNVYGATKAEAERRVLELLPEALIVRTSAFFGPWDGHNFLAHLFRTLDSGARFSAPSDSTVSPSHVPDLAHAALDLLIDGERGIWHLANHGAISWFDLARGRLAQRPSCRSGGAGENGRHLAAGRAPRLQRISSRRGQLLRPLDAALAAYIAEAPHARLATGTDGCVSR